MAIKHAKDKNAPYSILVKKGTFEKYSLKNKLVTKYDLSREDAIVKITKLLSDKDIIVATTGKTSRELFEFRSKNNKGHQRDFLTVGGMGHANQIALGIALSKPNKKVYCFDGDGAVIMHAGSLGIIGNLKPSNFKHIVLNNGSHDSVGGQPTIGLDISFSKIASNFKYNKTFTISKSDEFEKIFQEFKISNGPNLLEILINKGARVDLGRPTKSPLDNKKDFMSFLD